MVRKTVLTLGLLLGAALLGWLAIGSNPVEAEGERWPVQKSEAEWRAQLTPEQYSVLRGHGTERPFSSSCLAITEPGEFRCVGCERLLFRVDTKYDSGTGWPSFTEAVPESVATREDRSLGMSRTEVLCAGCGGHLGHVFGDGPPPTGLRYCINGVALTFRPAGR